MKQLIKNVKKYALKCQDKWAKVIYLCSGQREISGD